MPWMVTRYDSPHAHGWHVAVPDVWGLIPTDEADWPLQWERFVERSGVQLSDLMFSCREHREQFVRELGL